MWLLALTYKLLFTSPSKHAINLVWLKVNIIKSLCVTKFFPMIDEVAIRYISIIWILWQNRYIHHYEDILKLHTYNMLKPFDFHLVDSKIRRILPCAMPNWVVFGWFAVCHQTRLNSSDRDTPLEMSFNSAAVIFLRNAISCSPTLHMYAEACLPERVAPSMLSM